jgi:hydrogenase nickel incorporation protein HypA/HybF
MGTMHELGLLRGVVAAVERTAAARGAAGVEAVGLKVGALSGALPEALQGAWPLATAGTVAEGARLDLELVAAAVWCPACGRDQPIDEFFAWACPVCGGPATAVQGREFEVAYADVIPTTRPTPRAPRRPPPAGPPPRPR